MSKSRRAFINGNWKSGHPEKGERFTSQVEIVSLIVSTWPQHLDAVAVAILALGNAEIHDRDPKGRLIVVLEEASSGAVGAKTLAISALPHVLSAAMVFQASDIDDPAV